MTTATDTNNETLLTKGAGDTANPGGQPPTGGKPVDTPPADAAKKPDDKPADGAPADGAKKPDDKPADVAEIKYEIKAPEGVELDAEALGQYTGVLAKYKVSPEDAQALFDMAATRQAAATKQLEEAQQKEFLDTQKGWIEQVKNDPTLGGANFEKSKQAAREVVDTFGDADLVKFLKETGLGNHPALLKTFVNIRAKIADDVFVRGGAPAAASSTPEQRMYPSMAKKA